MRNIFDIVASITSVHPNAKTTFRALSLVYKSLVIMSEYRDDDAPHFAEIFDREMRVAGADYIAGLLHVHSRKSLKVINDITLTSRTKEHPIPHIYMES